MQMLIMWVNGVEVVLPQGCKVDLGRHRQLEERASILTGTGPIEIDARQC